MSAHDTAQSFLSAQSPSQVQSGSEVAGDNLPIVEHLQEVTPEDEKAIPSESFLEVWVGDESPVLLPMTSLVEITKVDLNQVVPMFQMHAWVMGVYNWRGEILWMVDLAEFLGLQPWHQRPNPESKHTVVILNPPNPTQSNANGTNTIGLVITQVGGMVTCPLYSLGSLPEDLPVIPELSPYITRYWDGSGLSTNQPPRPIMNAAALLEAMTQEATAAPA